jgi:hypothetical protein
MYVSIIMSVYFQINVTVTDSGANKIVCDVAYVIINCIVPLTYVNIIMSAYFPILCTVIDSGTSMNNAGQCVASNGQALMAASRCIVDAGVAFANASATFAMAALSETEDWGPTCR